MYVHTHPEGDDKNQIVGFEIEPFTIDHSEKLKCGNNSFPATELELLDVHSQEIAPNKTLLFTYYFIFR